MIAAVGASRSGKTHSAALAFFIFTQGIGPLWPDQLHLIIGQSFGVLKETLWQHLTTTAEKLGYTYEWNGTDRVLAINGVRYKFLAYANVQSETKPMGFTVHSILADESTLVGNRFFTLAVGRATAQSSKVWVLCNPTHPGHWLKKDFIDAGLFDEVLHFTFADNPILADSVKESLKKLYSGADYTRLVEGKWSAQSGVIYPEFEVVDWEDLPTFYVEEVTVAADPGYAAPYAGLAIARTRLDNYLVFGEYYWRPEDMRRTPAAHALAVMRLAEDSAPDRDWPVPSSFLVDPAAAGDCSEYESRGAFLPAVKKDLLSGIRTLRTQLEKPRYFILRCCENLISELQGLVWDEKASERGEDQPDPRCADHAADALRYHCSHHFPLDAPLRYV